MAAPLVFLIDNGSLRPQATLGLRVLAQALCERTGYRVEAVSLLHSHKIEASELGGVPATIVKRRLRECLAQGERSFICLPLFLGPSLAVVDYLPEVIEAVTVDYPDAEVRVAASLAGAAGQLPDERLARILAEQVRALGPSVETQVALVDHGTPYEPVNQVRNAVAGQLARLLEGEVAQVLACSMERREGDAYAFNDPLLENLGAVGGLSGGPLVLAMFFLLPGRHAGAGGDVASIYQGLLDAGAFERIETTALLAEHPLLIEILEDRLRAVAH